MGSNVFSTIQQGNLEQRLRPRVPSSWVKLDESHRSRGICQADPQKVILKYMEFH